MSSKKTAIILFNLGGPDSLDSVKPFLFNLFFDPAIIRLPTPLRFLIAKLISSTRNNKAKEIYSRIGGKSPILEETTEQKNALSKALKDVLITDFEIFICMRHWHPKSLEVVEKIKEYKPQEIILLPLYPHFSTTTTGSSLEDFIFAINKAKIDAKIKTICCYPIEDNFIKSHILLIKQVLEKLNKGSDFRILFSAHSLPVKIINEGDPYQWQIEQTVECIVNNLNISNLDYKITYQSKVGPVEWLKPATEDEIQIAGAEKKSLVIVPIAFVSEHVETLVELDIEYNEIAHSYGIQYLRVPTLRCDQLFVDALVNIIQRFSCEGENNICTSSNLKKICPNNFKKCISKANAHDFI